MTNDTKAKPQRPLFVSRYPRLAALLASGDVALEGPDYVGLASDGAIVSLGQVDAPQYVESYLGDHPTPETW